MTYVFLQLMVLYSRVFAALELDTILIFVFSLYASMSTSIILIVFGRFRYINILYKIIDILTIYLL